MAEIRWATLDDVPQLVKLGEAMHAESPRYNVCDFDPIKVAAVSQKFIRAPEHACVLIAEKGGRLVGMVAGFVAEHWFGPDKYAADMVVYVSPEWRGGSIFVKLMSRFEDWARSLRLKEVVLGISTGVDPETLSKIYVRLGYTQYGNVFVKRFSYV